MCGCTGKTVIVDLDGEFVNVTNGNLDVQLADQTTPFGIMPLILHKPNFTLSTPATIDTYTFDATAGHSIALGDVIVLKEPGFIYQGIAIGVVVNAITVDTPFFMTFTVADTVGEVGTADASVNGSVTRQVFSLGPPPASKWDLTKITIQIEDNTAMDTALFGGITALTRGVVIRKRNAIFQPMFNWKSNGQVILTTSKYAFDAKAPSGVFSFNAEIQLSGQSEYGVVVRVDGDLGDEIELIIQDDLTALNNFFVIVHGHMVTEE